MVVSRDSCLVPLWAGLGGRCPWTWWLRARACSVPLHFPSASGCQHTTRAPHLPPWTGRAIALDAAAAAHRERFSPGPRSESRLYQAQPARPQGKAQVLVVWNEPVGEITHLHSQVPKLGICDCREERGLQSVTNSLVAACPSGRIHGGRGSFHHSWRTKILGQLCSAWVSQSDAFDHGASSA